MSTRNLTPLLYELDASRLPPVPEILRALADRPGLVVLDSAGGKPVDWSIIAFDPFELFDGADPLAAPKTLDELEARLGSLCVTVDPDAAIGPFAGGFIGALSYDLGVRGEDLTLPAPAWHQPPVIGGLYRDWIVVERGSGEDGDAEPRVRAALVICEDSADGPRARVEAEARAFRTLSQLAALAADEPPVRGPSAEPARDAEPALSRVVSREEHCARIEATRQRIAEGEIYQANISHRMTADAPRDALELYLRLRESNPGPYMGFARFLSDGRRAALLSSSPELLVEVWRGADGRRHARTRPIKGTIGRGQTAEEDAQQIATLRASAKDVAELAMIVDLERNDLGRVAVPGGVTVEGFPTVETYAAVHHLVADVRAEISGDASAMDVVASLFPGGSITGAPKLRSMEVIAEQEVEGRGFFTGSLGFVDLRGHVALSILIRTMVHREGPSGGEVSFHVGGGITWQSDPEDEDDETLLKAEGMVRALAFSCANRSPVPSPEDGSSKAQVGPRGGTCGRR